MRKFKRLFTLVAIIGTTIVLASCSKTAENEHLPEYCRTYSGFMEFASADLYNLLGGINRAEYLSVISENELSFEAYDNVEEIDLDGIQCFQNLTSLSLAGPGFKDISEISALKNIQHISLMDTNVVNISSFRNLSKVNELTISNTKSLQSVEGVEEMTKLTYLDLSDNGIVNIDGLNNLLNLNTLILSNNEITFFPSINNLEYLETLDVSNNNIIQLGEDLSGLSNLVNFDASENEICDLSTLDDLVNLETLDLSFNDLGCNGSSPDFSSLEGATKLNELHLNDNGLTSISDLSGRDLPLEELHLENNFLTDITPISNFTLLTKLLIFNNSIVNINNLSGMTNITQIDLSENLIVDFSDLRSIPDLEKIDLSNNSITFIPDISDAWPSLNTLDLSNNVIDDTSGVEGHLGIKTLIINNNGLTSLIGISNLPSLENLVLYQIEDEDAVIPLDPEDNPNLISIIDNSYNSLPLIAIHNDEGELDLGYTLGPSVSILGSFNDNDRVLEVDLRSLDIDVIDEFSFNLEDLEGLYVQDNNLTDITFALGNPKLRVLNISNNPIGNLTIINGTIDDDFDNLEQVYAMNISGSNALNGAFVDLPDLNIISLTDTNIISIDNSFNNLDELTDLLISGGNLTFINNSFNNIFSVSSSSNIIQLLDGNLYSIVDSFNVGNYEQIEISGHSTLDLDPIISGSFNNIAVDNLDSIGISNNVFKTVIDSFNSVISDNLFLPNNHIEVISNSFVSTDIAFELNLQNNELSIMDLSVITNVGILDLSNNALTTFAFIDGIPGLDTLDVSSQLNAAGTLATITTIDGINNMEQLDNITFDNIPITTIDGFKNIGITEFDYDFSTNNNIFITSISATSFMNSQVTILNMGGHELTNIDFLSHFPLLEDLVLSVNMADLSGLNGSVFESTLTDFQLESVQNIPDFIVLQGYDSVTNLTIDSSLNVSVTNLDNLENVEEITFIQLTGITSFVNSYNNLPAINISETYINDFSALTNTTNSFDVYGMNGLNDTVELSGALNIVNSFNNVIEVKIENTVEVTPNYDSISFDDVEDLTFTHPLYSSYAFLTNYIALDTLIIEQLDDNLTDLVNLNIGVLEIHETHPIVDTLTVSISNVGTIDFKSTENGLVTINSNNPLFILDASNLDLSIYNNTTNVNLQGVIDEVDINNNLALTINLVSFNSTNVILNTNLVTAITSNAVSGDNADYVELNSTTNNINIDVRTSNILINNNLLDTVTFDAPISSVGINSVQPIITVNGSIDTLNLSYDLLTSLSVTGSIDTVTLDSNLLNTVSLGGSTINDLDVTSLETLITVTGTNLNNLIVTDNNIDDLVFTIPGAEITLYSTKSAPLDMNVTSDTILMNTSNISDITINDNSSVNTLNLNSLTTLNSLVYGAGNVNNTLVTTNSATLYISGTQNNELTLDSPNLNNLTVDLPSGTINMQTNVTALSGDIALTTLNLNDSLLLNTVTLTGTSSIGLFDFTSTPQIDTLSFNNANIGGLNIETNDTSFTLDGVNVIDSTITGDNLLSLDVDVSTNDLTFSSTKTGSMSVSLLADSAIMNMAVSSLALDNSSIVNLLDLSSSSLSLLLLGNGDIETLNVEATSTTFDISGTQLTTAILTSNINNLDISLPSTTDVTLNISANSSINIDTTTTDITVSANQDVTMDSSVLEYATVNIGNNIVTLNVDKPTLTFTLGGTMAKALFNTTTLDAVNFAPSTSISDLELLYTNVDTLDLSNTSIDTLDITGNVSTLAITSTTLTNVTLDTTNLVSLNLANSTNGAYIIDTDALTFDFDGTVTSINLTANTATALDFVGAMSSINLIANSMTTLDLLNVDANSVEITADNLTALDIIDPTIVIDSLILNSIQNNFNLASDSPNVTFNSNISNTLLFTSTALIQSIESNVDSIDLDGPSTSFTISAENLINVSGSANTILLEDGSTNGAITLSINADTVSVDNNSNTSVFLTGTTVANLYVTSTSVTNISTNNVVMDNLFANISGSTLSLDSLADTITVGTGLTDILFNNVRTNGQNISTYANDVTLNTTNASSTTLTYLGLGEMNVDINNLSTVDIVNENGSISVISGILSDLTLSGNSQTNVVIEGTMNNLTISGTLIDDVTTSALTVNTKYTMNNTLVLDLDYVSATLLANVNEIEMNTLNIALVEDILTFLEGSLITLSSPLTDADVYNYYYGLKESELNNQETISNFRYNSYYNPLQAAALAEFRLNSDFDFITEDQELLDEIDAQTYRTATNYLLEFAVSEGYATVQLMIDDDNLHNQGSVDAMEITIQGTLDSANLAINSAQINIDVASDIASESDVYAISERDNKGFTIG